MDSTIIFSCVTNILTFIILAIPGYISRKLKYLTSQQIDAFSFILVNFLWPCMIIYAMSSVTINSQIISMCIYTAGISFIFYALSLIISTLYAKIRHISPNQNSVFIFSSSFNNTGFIGMPLIKAVLGNEALLLSSIIELVNDIFIFSIGTLTFQNREKKQRKLNLKSLVSPCFISIFIGLIIFGFHITLPDLIKKPIGYMSDATTVIAMFLVGAQLGEIHFVDVFREKLTYEISFLRHLVLPTLLFVILLFTGKQPLLAKTVLLVMAATPVATCSAIFAREHKKDYLFATKSVLISTLFSAIFLPAWLTVSELYLK